MKNKIAIPIILASAVIGHFSAYDLTGYYGKFGNSSGAFETTIDKQFASARWWKRTALAFAKYYDWLADADAENVSDYMNGIVSDPFGGKYKINSLAPINTPSKPGEIHWPENTQNRSSPNDPFKTTDGKKTYSNSILSVDIPDGWRTLSANQKTFLSIAPENRTKELILFEQSKAPSNITAYLAAEKAGIINSGNKFINQTSKTINGCAAYMQIFTVRFPGEESKTFITVYFLKNKKMITATCMAPNSAFESYVDKFGEIIESVRIK